MELAESLQPGFVELDSSETVLALSAADAVRLGVGKLLPDGDLNAIGTMIEGAAGEGRILDMIRDATGIAALAWAVAFYGILAGMTLWQQLQRIL